MNRENAFRIIVLVGLLMAVVSCQEGEQKPPASVMSQEPAVAESEPVAPVEVPPEPAPVIIKATQEPAEAESATEPPVEVQADQIGPAEEVIVSYGEKKLTMRHIEYLQPKADAKTIKKIADWWLTTQLLAEEAAKRGVTQDPAVILRADLRAKQMHAEGLKEHVRNAVQVSEDQMRDYYEENKESDRRINEPAKLSFTHVASKTLEESQQVLGKIKAGGDIAALAKELSIDYDKRKNGAVRNSTETNVNKRFGAEFLNAILYASEGDIIGPIKATLGMGRGERYEVARFEGKVPGMIKSFDEVRDYIRTRVERAEQEKAVQDLLKSLEEKAADKIFRSEQILE
jgi:peptidyl-prolyl cis-trans isomerase C